MPQHFEVGDEVRIIPCRSSAEEPSASEEAMFGSIATILEVDDMGEGFYGYAVRVGKDIGFYLDCCLDKLL